MHIRIAHSLSHYILNTFILIGHRNEPHPPLNCRMGGISGYYFHAFGIIVWIGLWLASKLYLFSFVLKNHLLNKSCSPAHARIRSIFGVENHKSSSEFCLVVTGHICFCSLVWELIEIWVKPLLWALRGQTNTYPDRVNLFNMNWLQFMMPRTQWTQGLTISLISFYYEYAATRKIWQDHEYTK